MDLLGHGMGSVKFMCVGGMGSGGRKSLEDYAIKKRLDNNILN